MQNLLQAQLVMKGCTNWMEKLVVVVYQDVPNFGQREHQVFDFSPFAFQFRVALVGVIYTGKGPDVQSGKLILHTVVCVETGDVSLDGSHVGFRQTGYQAKHKQIQHRAQKILNSAQIHEMRLVGFQTVMVYAG